MRKKRILRYILFVGSGCFEVAGVCILLVEMGTKITGASGLFQRGFLLILTGGIIAFVAGQFLKESER